MKEDGGGDVPNQVVLNPYHLVQALRSSDVLLVLENQESVH